MTAAKYKPAKITSECREESLNTVCERNNAVKPGKRGKQKEKRCKSCRQLIEPFKGKQVDENDRPTARGDAEQHERQVGIMNEVRKQSAAANVKKITRRMRLVNSGIEVRHAQGKVHRVEIVGVVAPKKEARESYSERESRCVYIAVKWHVQGLQQLKRR
jgi:hypothetical protein